jgi:hypothetical protein
MSDNTSSKNIQISTEQKKILTQAAKAMDDLVVTAQTVNSDPSNKKIDLTPQAAKRLEARGRKVVKLMVKAAATTGGAVAIAVILDNKDYRRVLRETLAQVVTLAPKSLDSITNGLTRLANKVPRIASYFRGLLKPAPPPPPTVTQRLAKVSKFAVIITAELGKSFYRAARSATLWSSIYSFHFKRLVPGRVPAIAFFTLTALFDTVFNTKYNPLTPK